MDRDHRLFRFERLFGGYAYAIDRVANNRRYLRCQQRYRFECRARAIIINETIFQLRREHNHPPNQAVPNIIQAFERDLFEAVTTQNRHLRVIYNDIARQHREAAVLRPYENMYDVLRNWRLNDRATPRVHTLAEFQRVLYTDEWRNLRTVGAGANVMTTTVNIHNAGRDEVIIFSNLSALNLLTNVQILFVNFSTTHQPDFDGVRSLITVSAVINNFAIPIVYSCIKSNSLAALTAIMNLVSTFVESPQQIYIDDSIANMRLAVTHAFPEIILVTTSYYYFAKDILRKVVDSGITIANETERGILNRLINIALLPEEAIETTLTEIARNLGTLTEKFEGLVNYISLFWIRRIGVRNFTSFPNFFAISDTNRAIENFIGTRIKRNSTIWEFLDFASTNLALAYEKILALQNNQRRNIPFPLLRSLIERATININWRKLRRDPDFTITRFLDALVYQSEEVFNILIFNNPVLRQNPMLLRGHIEDPAPAVAEAQEPEALQPVAAQEPVRDLAQEPVQAVVQAVAPMDVAAMAAPVAEGAVAAPVAEAAEAPIQVVQLICDICWDNEKTLAIIPCGHYGLCDSCATKLRNSPCPWCRTVFTDVLRVFHPI